MERWTPIQYRDFYDFPRIFVAKADGRTLLFDCKFNSDDDDYEDVYTVYLMPSLTEEDLAGSWETLPSKALTTLGQVRSSDLEFDPTFRRHVNLKTVERLIS